MDDGSGEKPMLKPSLADITTCMISSFGALRHLGDDREFAKVFPFVPEDVEGAHTHKLDEGYGLWYRLKDGRVFSMYGQPCPEDDALYDKVQDENADKALTRRREDQEIRTVAASIQEEAVEGMKRCLGKAHFSNTRFASYRDALQAAKAALDFLLKADLAAAKENLARAAEGAENARHAPEEEEDPTE
jgi:hypothetical protein